MVVETSTQLAPEAVIERAKEFFATRVPASSAFVERQSDRYIVMRGQGGEEVVIAAMPAGGGARVRGSTMLFAGALQRFFSTLPPAAAAAGVA